MRTISERFYRAIYRGEITRVSFRIESIESLGGVLKALVMMPGHNRARIIYWFVEVEDCDHLKVAAGGLRGT